MVLNVDLVLTRVAAIPAYRHLHPGCDEFSSVRVAVGHTLRRFTHLFLQPVRRATTVHRGHCASVACGFELGRAWARAHLVGTGSQPGIEVKYRPGASGEGGCDGGGYKMLWWFRIQCSRAAVVRLRARYARASCSVTAWPCATWSCASCECAVSPIGTGGLATWSCECVALKSCTSTFMTASGPANVAGALELVPDRFVWSR